MFSIPGWRCLVLLFKCLSVLALSSVEMSFSPIIPFHLRRRVVSCVLILVLKSTFEYSISVRRCLEDEDCDLHLVLHCTGSSVKYTGQALTRLQWLWC